MERTPEWRVQWEIIIKEGFSDDPKKYGIKAREDESIRSMTVIIGNVTDCEDLRSKDWKRGDPEQTSLCEDKNCPSDNAFGCTLTTIVM